MRLSNPDWVFCSWTLIAFLGCHFIASYHVVVYVYLTISTLGSELQEGRLIVILLIILNPQHLNSRLMYLYAGRCLQNISGIIYPKLSSWGSSSTQALLIDYFYGKWWPLSTVSQVKTLESFLTFPLFIHAPCHQHILVLCSAFYYPHPVKQLQV